MRIFIVFLFTVILAGCSSNKFAPVEERNRSQTLHVVKKGETLYSIAFRYDQDYRSLATYNHIGRTYALRVGQVLRIPRKHFISFLKRPYKAPAAKKAMVRKIYPYRNYRPKQQPRLSYAYGNWHWPAFGKVVSHFYPEAGKKGIDIAGKRGASVYAAYDGVVAYAGNGLSGYGNLIIIKHANQFLTAYGNNQKNSVVEGQKVKAGQVIAEMGLVDRRFWGVHFELRKHGQPVNPLRYLRSH